MFLTVDELPSPVRARMSDPDLVLLIEDAESRAMLAAPCLAGALSEGQRAQVVAVLRGAVSRAAKREGGYDQQMTAGPFTFGAPPGANEPRALFWPTELDEPRAVCGRRRAHLGWLA